MAQNSETYLSRIKRTMRLEYGFDLDVFKTISLARPCPCKACDNPFATTTAYCQTKSGRGIVFCREHGELMSAEVYRKGGRVYGQS